VEIALEGLDHLIDQPREIFVEEGDFPARYAVGPQHPRTAWLRPIGDKFNA